MFVAASTHSFGELDFTEALRQIVDLEYDKVELWLSEEGPHLKPSEVAADPERIITRLRETSRLTPIAISIEDDVDRRTLAGVAKLAKLLRIAQITIPASPLGTPFNTEIDRLRTFVGVAGEASVRLSLKTQTGHLTEDPHTAVELCQSVKGLGLTLDPSFYICGPHRGQPFDQVYPHVYHVHLRDTSPDEIQVPAGLGEIDYSRLIAQLAREGYNLALSVELFPERTDPETRELEMRKLRMLLETLL
ncbi:MAG: sugar phosphate isomerase/epimerase [Planctomycetes bacterium]|nr:sugar phosphate isomerase/epimerase [Planctomycetota bacterium]